MTPDDPTLTRAERVLTTLPRHEPRRAHAERLRARCHRELAKQPPPCPDARPAIERRWRALGRTALVLIHGLEYLVSALRPYRRSPAIRPARQAPLRWAPAPTISAEPRESSRGA